MRGKLSPCDKVSASRRITPACAGKTRRVLRTTRQCKDHPRVCGENRGLSMDYNSDEGSPPRVRGKLSIRRGSPFRLRITPACAGKTTPSCRLLTEAQDHPRVCGENRISEKRIPSRGGSPPRVRGKPAWRGKCQFNRRITPACAGKTAAAPRSRRR